MRQSPLSREQNEAVVQLKGACPDKRLPRGLLSDKNAMQDGTSSKIIASHVLVHYSEDGRQYQREDAQHPGAVAVHEDQEARSEVLIMNAQLERIQYIH
jgi:hypothetical protein